MSRWLKASRAELGRATRRVGNRVRRVTLATAATARFFIQAQGMEGETFEAVEVWQQYGLASRPPAGGEALVVEPDEAGAGEGALAVATQDRAHRPDMDAGEVVLYGKKATGQPAMRLRPNGHVDIDSGSGATTVNVGGDATTCVNYALLGTAHDSEMRTMMGVFVTQLPLMAGFFSTESTGWQTLKNNSSAGFSTTEKNAFDAAAKAAEELSLACGLLEVSVNAYLAGSYLATKVKVK